jgi:chemotaxis signal transduction protein
MSDVHLRVRVGSERYAFPIADVSEVAELGTVVPVAGAPHSVRGVRNLRGQIVPVIDLGDVLGVQGDGKLPHLVVAEHAGQAAGFVVDELENVETLPASSERAESRYLTGAMLVDGSLVGVVDVAEVLASASTFEDER